MGPNGQLATQTDSLGNTTTSRYDEADQLIAEIDPLGHTTQYSQTLKGRTNDEPITNLRPNQ
jgi:YD repeat-containing protein